MAAPVVIPQTTQLSFPPTGIQTVLLLSLLFRQGTAFANAMSFEMTGFEVTKFVEFIKGHIIDGPNIFPNTFVEVEHLGVGARMD